MILTDQEIYNGKIDGKIVIEPFNFDKLNPNSYNLTLHDELVVYNDGVLDMKKDNPWRTIKIPKDGYLLKPGKLYLGRTREYTETREYVPMIEGRSSIGRLGIFIHSTAGFGDNGFCGYWTLEISCVQPVMIYPGIDICQIYYHSVSNKCDSYGIYSGKYQSNTGIQTSQIFREFEKKEGADE